MNRSGTTFRQLSAIERSRKSTFQHAAVRPLLGKLLQMLSTLRIELGPLILLAVGIVVTGCSSNHRLEVEKEFPVPVMDKTPVQLGVLLDEDLLGYVHEETIENKGSWEVAIGVAQQNLFNNLALGVFEGYDFVDRVEATKDRDDLDGVLKPHIAEVQFSLPDQTRSDYYEVWIRYQFKLFDKAGTMIGEWSLPAYGKAKEKDFGSRLQGMQAAAIAACRDAMAFFSINFAREKVVHDWIAAGKPLAPPPAPTTTAATPPATTPATNGAATPASSNDTQDASAKPVSAKVPVQTPADPTLGPNVNPAVSPTPGQGPDATPLQANLTGVVIP